LFSKDLYRRWDKGQTFDETTYVIINGRRLVGTTLLKGDERRHVLLRGGETSYLTDETWGRHVLVVCVKWQNGTD
jgi:hypothetical protein